jgi:hypothetical protein
MITQKGMYRTQEILARLRRGEVVRAERESGKTTALLMLAHAIGQNGCIVVLHQPALESYAQDLWKSLYPKEQPPRFISARLVRPAIIGFGLKVLVDEIAACHCYLDGIDVFAGVYT